MKLNDKRVLSLVIPIISGLPVASQTAVAEEQAFALEEIVVTAQRREQSLQDVPIAVSAVDADTLKQAGVTGLHDLGSMVSGVSLGNSQAASSVASIRGVNSEGFGFGLESSVPFYLDGVYLGSGYNTLGELMDVAQIEVLKGPQGTLFGRNASAGAINVRTVRPDNEISGKIAVDVGNYDLKSVKMSGNLPVIEDVLMVRGGYQQSNRDGWQTNVVSGEKDGFESDRWSAYIKGLWLPSESVEVEFGADWSRHDDHSGYISIDATSPSFAPFYDFFADPASFTQPGTRDYAAGAAPIFASLGQLTGGMVPDNTPRAIGVVDAAEPERDRKVRGTSLKVTWDVSDSLTFQSISSFRKSEAYLFTDPDGSDLGMLSQAMTTAYEEINQEFRLNGTSDQVDWFLGFNAYHQNADYSLSSQASGLVPANLLGTHILLGGGGGAPVFLDVISRPIEEESVGENTSTSYGIYGDVIWRLNERTNLTVGARYSYDYKEYQQGDSNNNSWNGGGIVFPNIDQLENPDDRKLDKSWNNLSGRIVLDYALNEDAMLYVSLAQGYKSGGFNTTRTLQEAFQGSGVFVMPTSAAEPFDEETNLNFEVGVKSTLMDGRLRFNASAYAYEYKNLQFLFSDSDVPVARTVNASKVDGHGVDVEATYLVSENLTVFANLAYLQSEFGDDVLDREGGLKIPKGQETVYAPEMSGSVGIDYVHQLAGVGELRTNLMYSYTGSHRQRAIQVGANFDESIGIQSGYGLINGRISLTSESGKWEASLWGKNLTDEDYATISVTAGATLSGVIGAIAGEPRTYGASVEYHF